MDIEMGEPRGMLHVYPETDTSSLATNPLYTPRVQFVCIKPSPKAEFATAKLP
mgnify:CR=1 FL=1